MFYKAQESLATDVLILLNPNNGKCFLRLTVQNGTRGR